MINFYEYINTDEFILYGFLVYYFLIPGFILLLVYIAAFISDYSEFRDWKKNKDKKED